MTKFQLKILQQAIEDGGKVVLTGLDKHSGWNKRHINAACQLHIDGYGQYNSGISGMLPAEFVINQKGKEYVISKIKD